MPIQDPVAPLNAALEGRYRIERQLGEGGMATVYLADDLRHERKVALKVLKPELAAVVGAERFLAEIKTTANLQHPHILPLFDSGEADKFLFYVMPYVEGDTLRQRIDREKQLGVDEALAITRKVASALDYAHKHGVVHRDVKPANILLSEQGEPLVADFGIALAVAQAGGGRITETGLSLGTPHYMAPEQATGDRDVDKRADVYSLGCVLYEMLAGEPPFSASTAQAILAKILTMDAPSITMVRKTVSPNVGAALAKALEKLPADRFTSAADFSAALADPGFTYEARRRTNAAEAPAAVARVSAAAGPWKRLSIALASLLVLATGVATWALLQPEPPHQVSREYLSTDWVETIGSFGNTVAISPDGSRMILPIRLGPNDWQLGLKLRASTEITPIPGTERAQSVVFSPDGNWIVYQGQNGTDLVKRPLVGGAPVTLANDVALGLAGVAWLDDGTILYDQEVGDRGTARAMRISEDGGEPLGVAFELAEIFYMAGLPGARGAIVMGCSEYNCGTDRQGNFGAYIVDLRDGSLQRAIDGAARAWYSPTGHLLYVRADGAVLAAGFDLGSLSISSAGVPLFEGVRVNQNLQAPAITIGADGTALYVEGLGGNVNVQMRLAVVDTAGTEEVLTLPSRRIDAVSWLPDGRSIVYVSDEQIYTYDTDLRTTPRRLTSAGVSMRPVASPDGRRLVFSGRRNDSPEWDLYVLRLDDPDAEARPIVSLPGDEFATQWPTDSLLLFEHAESSGQDRDLWIADLADPANPSVRVYLPQEGNDAGLSVSPDGKLAAYASNESGVFGAYIRGFPGGERPLLVGAVEGLNCCPFWSPDGNTLYWGTLDGPQGRAWLRARLTRGPGLEIVSRDTVFTGPYLAPDYGALHPNGDRWIVRERVGGGPENLATQRVVLVENLFEELKGLEQ